MNDGQNSKVVGAFVVGFALVALSYVVANFGASSKEYPQPAINQAAPSRVAIKVSDSNNNGIEDWKETIFQPAPILAPAPEKPAEEYTPPDTITGQFGIELYKNIIRAKGAQQFGASNEEVVINAVDSVAHEVEDELYTVSDIIIIPNSESAYRDYPNTAGALFIEHNIEGVREPTELMRRALDTNDPEAIANIERQALMYKALRDSYLNTPVPEALADVHLVFVNAFNALYNDLDGFTDVFEDPLYTLLRVKRYQDDAVALQNAINLMDEATEEIMNTTTIVFTAEDPAAVFYFLQTR